MSLTSRLRLALPCAAVAASLAVAGCGGGDKGASKSDYQGALNGFCSAVESGATKVQTDSAAVTSSAAKDPNAAVEKLGDILATFAQTIDGGLDKLKKADVPDDYKSFNDQAVKGVDQLVSQVESAAKQARAGKVQAVTKLGSALEDIKLPDLPKDLSDKSAACKRISNG